MNYADLKNEVKAFIHRTDLDSKMDIFCELAESMINKDLRVHEMETRSTDTYSTNFTDLPTDYLEGRAFHLNVGAYRRAIEFMTPQQLDKTYSNTNGTPRAYTIQGGQIEIRPGFEGSPVTTYDGDFTYYARVPTLRTNTSNDILTYYPLVYLSAMLVQANAYVQDNEEVAKWSAVYDEQIKTANKTNAGGRYILPTVRNT